MWGKNHSNPKRLPEKRKISWGKHAGKKFGEVGTQYLMWFIKKGFSQMKERKKWAKEELVRRGVMYVEVSEDGKLKRYKFKDEYLGEFNKIN